MARITIETDDDTTTLETVLTSALTCELVRIRKLLKEIKRTMATQADVDAVTAQLEALKVEVAKIGSDLVAFITANPSITTTELAAKATEVGNALQAVDDLLPEQPTP